MTDYRWPEYNFVSILVRRYYKIAGRYVVRCVFSKDFRIKGDSFLCGRPAVNGEPLLIFVLATHLCFSTC